MAQMARENFLWGAPRIHGELLMLDFSISQATVSHYLPAQAEGQNSRGGPFFAMKPVLSASIPHSGRRGVLTCMLSPVGLHANDPRWR
jgi:hypothetical protein